MKRRICIISESNSNNLGDQAICRALTGVLEIRYLVAHASFGMISDHSRGQKEGRKKRAANLLAAWLPLYRQPRTKARIRWHILKQKQKFENYYSPHIEGSDLVLIGGGQLIKNNTALFCEKLALIAAICCKNSTSFALIGVGVDEHMEGDNWRTVKSALENSEFSIFRDQESMIRAEEQIKSKKHSLTLPDLGFSLRNQICSETPSIRKLALAVNVMDILALEKHFADPPKDWLEELIVMLSKVVTHSEYRQRKLALFTTGSPQDLIAARKIRTDIHIKTGIELEIFHPTTLDELLWFLSQVRDVIATRMHAGILAYISGCNPVCISWDNKIEGVWANIQQEKRVTRLSDFISGTDPVDFIGLLRELHAPSSAELHDLAQLVEQGVLENVAKVLESPATEMSWTSDA